MNILTVNQVVLLILYLLQLIESYKDHKVVWGSNPNQLAIDGEAQTLINPQARSLFPMWDLYFNTYVTLCPRNTFANALCIIVEKHFLDLQSYACSAFPEL